MFWILWACLAKQAQRDTINLYKTFVFICRQKMNFIPHALLEILQRHANFLFWILWACLVAHTQNDSINLYKTLMFIGMKKTHFIIHLFLEILHFKESCNFIRLQHQELEFCQIRDWRRNINSNTSFYFRLFSKKNYWKRSLKNPKRTYFLVILHTFYPNLGKNEFSCKKELYQFLDIPIIYHPAKSQQKLLSSFWGKHQTDGQTDRQRTVIL